MQIQQSLRLPFLSTRLGPVIRQWVGTMGPEDSMMSFQLRQMLDRLEAEEEQKQKTLTQRVKEERVKLEATMAFSRAAALAALAQESKLQKVLEAEQARLQAASKSKLKPMAPELTGVEAEGRDRVLKENRRLAEEVIQLRAQVHEVAAVATTSAVARPAMNDDAPNDTANDVGLQGPRPPKLNAAETLATHVSTLSGIAGQTSRSEAPPPSSDGGVLSGPRGEEGTSIGAEVRRANSVEAKDESPAAISPESDAHAPALIPPPLVDKKSLSTTTNDDDRIPSNSIGGVDEEEVRRMVDAEAAQVLEELRANPPAAARALLRVRKELDACAAAAAAMRKTVSSILLAAPTLPAVSNSPGPGAAVASCSKADDTGSARNT